MKLYYYTYETTVLRPFFDTEYDLYEGFLIDSPLGLVHLDRNFDIVELK